MNMYCTTQCGMNVRFGAISGVTNLRFLLPFSFYLSERRRTRLSHRPPVIIFFHFNFHVQSGTILFVPPSRHQLGALGYIVRVIIRVQQRQLRSVTRTITINRGSKGYLIVPLPGTPRPSVNKAHLFTFDRLDLSSSSLLVRSFTKTDSQAGTNRSAGM